MLLLLFLLLSFSFGVFGSGGDPVRVFVGQQLVSGFGSQTDPPQSGFRLIHEREVRTRDLTICVRYKGRILWNHIFNIKMDGVSVLFLSVGDETWITFGYPRREGSSGAFLVQDDETKSVDIYHVERWMHLCFAYEKETGDVRYAVNGRIINYLPGFLPDVQFPSDFLNHTRFGYYIDAANGFECCSCPECEISDFNAWDRAFTAREAVEWTSCQNRTGGNLVDWNRAEFGGIFNYTQKFVSMDEICVPPTPGYVLFPTRKPFSRHLQICRQFRGKAVEIPDETTESRVAQKMLGDQRCSPDPDNLSLGAVWIAYSDEETEGTFVNVNTGDRLGAEKDPYQNWDRLSTEPNGGTIENCASLRYQEGVAGWNDMPCEGFPLCFLCNMDQFPYFNIRGLCPKSNLNTFYGWTYETIMDDGTYQFKGYVDSRLYHDSATGMWRLESLKNSSIYALTSTDDYPFGRRKWEVHNDVDCDNGGEKGENDNVFFRELSFSACNISEFNCLDGTCVEIERRCDRVVDCPDKSDETSCQLVLLEPSYLKTVPPPPLEGKQKAEVEVEVDLISILDIKEVDYIISLQIDLRLTWLDKRLSMKDLHSKTSLNTLTGDAKHDLWIPQVVFYNTNDKEESKNDGKAFVTIGRNGSFDLAPASRLENSRTYRGSENPVTVSRVYTKDFLCEFHIQAYPFDTQECSTVFVMKGNLGSFVDLVPKGVQYLGPIDLSLYFVQDFSISKHTVPPNLDAVKVDIVFSRRILATLLVTYVPTALLCIVCFTTNFFKPFFFEAAVTVNLTSLLVLTTLFISVYNSLPATSYIKMIDVWLLFTLTIPFSEVVLHTYIDSLRGDSNRTINHHGASVEVEGSSKKKSKVIQVQPSSKKTNKNDETRVEPLTMYRPQENPDVKSFYSDFVVARETRMRVASKMASVGIPVTFTLFSCVYFFVGLNL